MKSALWSSIGCLVLVAAASAQSDPFDGTWKLNVAKSTSRDMPEEEILTIKVSDHAQYKRGDVTSADGSIRASDYTAKYNDGKWYPVRNLESDRPGGTTMMIRMDARSEVRFMKSADGALQSMLVRVVAEDGKTMRITGLGFDGQITYNLLFEKQ